VEAVQKQVTTREPRRNLGVPPARSVLVLENFDVQKPRAANNLGMISTFPSPLRLLLVL
jgi:hypothetical protein